MGIIDTIKHVFTTEGKAMYRCEDCNETFKVDVESADPTCPTCDSTDVTFINQV